MAAPTNAAKREKSSCQPGAVHTWHFNLHKKDKDVTMKRDLLVMGGAMLALGLAMWMVWGNPEMSSTPKASVVQSFGRHRARPLRAERTLAMLCWLQM